MKFLKGLLVTLLVLFLVYCVVMFFLPSKFTMERQVTIEAKPERVYNTVVDLTSWKNWSYWDLSDSTNVVTYDGTPGEVGSSYSWNGTTTGQGTFTIAALEPNKRMDFDLLFVGMGESQGYFTFESIEEGETRVTYAFTTEFGFFDRIGSFFMEGALGTAYEESLANLKAYIESTPATVEIPEYDVQMLTVESLPYYGIKETVKISEMQEDYFASKYQALSTYLEEDMSTSSMPPFAIFEKWDEQGDEAIIITAMNAVSEKPATDNIMKGETYAGDVLKIDYYGSYEKSGMAHYAMDAYMKENGYEMAGMPYEVYVSDPSTETDESKLHTEVYYPAMKKEMMEEEVETES